MSKSCDKFKAITPTIIRHLYVQSCKDPGLEGHHWAPKVNFNGIHGHHAMLGPGTSNFNTIHGQRPLNIGPFATSV